MNYLYVVIFKNKADIAPLNKNAVDNKLLIGKK